MSLAGMAWEGLDRQSGRIGSADLNFLSSFSSHEVGVVGWKRGVANPTFQVNIHRRVLSTTDTRQQTLACFVAHTQLQSHAAILSWPASQKPRETSIFFVFSMALVVLYCIKKSWVSFYRP